MQGKIEMRLFTCFVSVRYDGSIVSREQSSERMWSPLESYLFLLGLFGNRDIDTQLMTDVVQETICNRTSPFLGRFR